MPKRTGLIGYPTEHSLSPAIHEYWMRAHGIEGEYKLFTTASARLRQTMLHMRKKQMLGINITVPHKESVMEHLDAIDAIATKIGAVNTITVEGETYTGTNTDGYGLIENLRSSCGGALPDLSRVVILGAGGAARAAVVALQEAGAAHITLSNRTFETAQKLAGEFTVQAAAWDMTGACLLEATLVVNTTSLGMKGQPPLNMSLQHLPATAIVYDIVYNPMETALIKAAKHRGNLVVGGLGMLLYQAKKAFALWHSIEPVVDDALRKHVIQVLRNRGDA